MNAKNQVVNKIRIHAKRLHVLNLHGNLCSICGKTGHCLSFHHIDPSNKLFNVSKGIQQDNRLEAIIKEADKCILVCENCHRDIHISQNSGGNDKAVYVKGKLLSSVNKFKCERCGYSKHLGCLEFHHTESESKCFNLSDVVIGLVSMQTKIQLSDAVLLELSKCEVLCSACHREVHFDSEFYNKHLIEIEHKAKNIRTVQAKIDRDLVVALFRAGIKPIAIASQLNASKGTISDILKSRGLTTSLETIKNRKCVRIAIKEYGDIEEPKNNKKFNPSIEELSVVVKTMSLRKVAMIYGVSQVTVFNRCRKLGISTNKH